jgi:hypothetical protein
MLRACLKLNLNPLIKFCNSSLSSELNSNKILRTLDGIGFDFVLSFQIKFFSLKAKSRGTLITLHVRFPFQSSKGKTCAKLC